jgi:hypothetical protein
MDRNLHKVLLIGLVWPEPDATAAGIRTMQILQLFIDLGYQVTFAATASGTPYSADLDELGVATAEITLNHPSFDEFIQALEPDIVVFDRYLTEEQFGWRVAKMIPDSIRIIDTQDLHSLRNSRQIAVKEEMEFTSAKWLSNEITKRELASIFRSDLSLVISEFEMSFLREHTPLDASQLYYFPFLYKNIDEARRNTWSPFEERANFIFIGNGKHAPNVDAILWLKTAIWPLIRKSVPKAVLRIYGAYLPQNILELNDPANDFHILGWIAGADTVMQQARVNLVPLRFGAGIKGKLVLALNCGTPSVTTELGAEGLFMENDHFCVAGNPEDFAKKAIELYRDKSIWQKAQNYGTHVINEKFKKEEKEQEFNRRILEISRNLSLHRTKNIVGSMLMHHTMASTKYLSRWIELKNSMKAGINDPGTL